MVDYKKLKKLHTLVGQKGYRVIHKFYRQPWDDEIYQLFELIHPLKGHLLVLDIEDAIHAIKYNLTDIEWPVP